MAKTVKHTKRKAPNRGPLERATRNEVLEMKRTLRLEKLHRKLAGQVRRGMASYLSTLVELRDAIDKTLARVQVPANVTRDESYIGGANS